MVSLYDRKLSLIAPDEVLAMHNTLFPAYWLCVWPTAP